MNRPTRLERLILKLMVMRVHPVVYLCLWISIWHCVVTIFNGIYLPTTSSFIFMGSPLLNILTGGVGIVAGLALAVALSYSWWRTSSGLALISMAVWTFTLVMLGSHLAWAGMIMSLFYMIVHLYISIASSLHHIYGYEKTKSPRQEFYENQEQTRL